METPVLVQPAHAGKTASPVRSAGRLLWKTYGLWSDRQAPRLGAAVAFYAIFSLTPLLVTTVFIAGLFAGTQFARAEFLEQLTGLLGTRAADAVAAMMTAAGETAGKSSWAEAAGTIALFVGATGVFAELRNALDTIGNTRASRDHFISWFVRGRLWSFALVLAVGFLLLISLIASAIIAALGSWFTSAFPVLSLIAIALNLLLSLSMLMLLFAMLMRWLPTQRRGWREVWPGALLASILLELGKELLGYYLGRAAFTDLYGAAGSLVVMVIWIYFAVQIFLYGAALNEVRALTLA